jgi:hypothetical protein
MKSTNTPGNRQKIHVRNLNRGAHQGGFLTAPPEYGIHHWLPQAARQLRNQGWLAKDIINLLYWLESRCRRKFAPNEVEQAVNFVFEGQVESQIQIRGRSSLPSSSAFSPEKLRAIARRMPEVDESWLMQRSPIPVEAMNPSTFLRHLYSPGERVLCFTNLMSQGELLWEHSQSGQYDLLLDNWIPGFPDGAWFLLQPVSGDYVQVAATTTSELKFSRRCGACATTFRYALLESDTADPRHWLSLLAQLPLPIVSITSSGGKSVHALVRVNAQSKEDWDQMVRGPLLRALVPFGADPAALTAVRLTRLPGVYRAGRLQQLFYLNPQATKTPIAKA